MHQTDDKCYKTSRGNGWLLRFCFNVMRSKCNGGTRLRYWGISQVLSWRVFWSLQMSQHAVLSCRYDYTDETFLCFCEDNSGLDLIRVMWSESCDHRHEQQEKSQSSIFHAFHRCPFCEQRMPWYRPSRCKNEGSVEERVASSRLQRGMFAVGVRGHARHKITDTERKQAESFITIFTLKPSAFITNQTFHNNKSLKSQMNQELENVHLLLSSENTSNNGLYRAWKSLN